MITTPHENTNTQCAFIYSHVTDWHTVCEELFDLLHESVCCIKNSETLVCWFLENAYSCCAPCAAVDMFCRLYSMSRIMRPQKIPPSPSLFSVQRDV